MKQMTLTALRALPFLLFTALLLTFSTQAQSISGFDLGNVELQALGSSSEIRIGQFTEVAKLRVSNRARNNLRFETLRLRNYGTADLTKSFDNVVITTSTGEVLADLVDVSRKYWTWKFRDEIRLNRGDSVILSVKARLIYSTRGKTIELGLRRDEDLNITDIGSGFGVRCEACEGTRFKEHRLSIGAITLSRDTTFRASQFRNSSQRNTFSTALSGVRREPNTIIDRRTLNTFAQPSTASTGSTINTFNRFQDSNAARSRARSAQSITAPRGSQQLSPGSKDVVFFSSRLSSRSAVGVDGVFLQLGSGSIVQDKDGDGRSTTVDDINEAFGNWRLFVNGRSEDSSNEVETYRGSIGVLFDSSIDIPANAQISMVGRIKNSAQNGDKVRFGLSGNGLIDPVFLFNGNAVNNINSSTSGNFSNVR